MILRPFFSFYGSKWRLAPKYPEPTHDTIIEPFAGSAGYSLRYPDRQVILVDKDPIITGIWRWLIAASPSDVLTLPEPKQGESLDDYDLPQEARWLMGFWIHRVGFKPTKIVTKYATRPPVANYKTRVARQLPYIRHWRIAQADYTGIANTMATWFVDPPYQLAGHRYTYGCSNINYDKLAEWCKARRGQVITCENSGADWLPFQPLCTQQGFTYRGEVKYSEEAVWLNGTLREMN